MSLNHYKRGGSRTSFWTQVFSPGTCLAQSLPAFSAGSSSAPTLLCPRQPHPFPELHQGLAYISPAQSRPPSFRCMCPTAHLAPDASDTHQNPHGRVSRKTRLKLAYIARNCSPYSSWNCPFRLARWLLPFQTHPDVTVSSKIKRILFVQWPLSKSKNTFPRSSPEVVPLFK